MIGTILLDLGNTLVRYYTSEQFPGVLRRAIGATVEAARRAASRGATS